MNLEISIVALSNLICLKKWNTVLCFSQNVFKCKCETGLDKKEYITRNDIGPKQDPDQYCVLKDLLVSCFFIKFH